MDAINKISAQQLLLPDWVKNIYLVPEKSKGSYIFDKNSDRSILDFFSFFSTLPLGYNHPIYSSSEFLNDLAVFGGFKFSTGRIRTDYFDRFVEEFHNYVNDKIFNKYFFIHGGGLAVENALKIAFDWKRYVNEQSGIKVEGNDLKIIALEEGFHGVTGYGLSLSSNELKGSHFPKFDWPKFKAPYMRFPYNENDKEEFIVEQKNALSSIEEHIEQRGKQYFAAIIIELIQGGGGDRHLGKYFVQGLKDICDKYNILLIFDEVQTGFGSTGKLWCYEHYGVTPHILTFGKKAQISGVCIGGHIPEIENVTNVPGRLSPTWNGDITDYIRCKYIMKAFKDDYLIENAAELGQYIISELNKMNKFSNVRGRGFLIAFDFESPKMRDKYDDLCFQEGLFLLAMKDKTLRMRPNMALTKKEADHALDIMHKVNRIL